MKNKESLYVAYQVVGWWKNLKGKRKKHVLFSGTLEGETPNKLKVEIDSLLSLLKKDDPRKIEFGDVYRVSFLCKLKHLHCP